MKQEQNNKKPSDYWGAITDLGIIYLMHCKLTRVTYITALFIFQEVGANNLYQGTVSSLHETMVQSFDENKELSNENLTNSKKQSAPAKQSVYNAVEELVDNHILYKIPNKHEYFVNPLIYYKGGKKQLKGLTAKFLQLAGYKLTDTEKKGGAYRLDYVDKFIRKEGLPIIDQVLGSLNQI